MQVGPLELGAKLMDNIFMATTSKGKVSFLLDESELCEFVLTIYSIAHVHKKKPTADGPSPKS